MLIYVCSFGLGVACGIVIRRTPTRIRTPPTTRVMLTGSLRNTIPATDEHRVDREPNAATLKSDILLSE